MSVMPKIEIPALTINAAASADAGAASHWRVWQLVDSAFPAGGFAHSGGLEAAWQAGWVRSSADMGEFILEFIAQLAEGSLPLIHAAVKGGDFQTLDAYQDSLMPNHVANRASRAQGMALLATAESSFDIAELRELRVFVLRSRAPTHHTVVFGTLMRMLAVEPRAALEMFLFTATRSLMSAAVRLGIVGPLEAQRLQTTLDSALNAAVTRGITLAPEEACQVSPMLELWQMSQDRLYSRLFQS